MVGSMEETFQLVLEGKEALVLFIKMRTTSMTSSEMRMLQLEGMNGVFIGMTVAKNHKSDCVK